MTGPALAQRSLRGPDPYPRVSGLSWTWLSAHGPLYPVYHCTHPAQGPSHHLSLPPTQGISPAWPERGGLPCHVHKFVAV